MGEREEGHNLNRANVFFWLAFFFLLFLNWVIFKPILGPLVFAVLAGAFYPVFEKIQDKGKMGSNQPPVLHVLLL